MSLKTAAAQDASQETVSGPERRTSSRFSCCRRCNAWPQGGVEARAWPGIIYNISTTGIGVVLPGPLTAGATLTIDLFGGRKNLRAKARVIRSSLHEFAFFHGCEFVEPLKEDEVRAWLK